MRETRACPEVVTSGEVLSDSHEAVTVRTPWWWGCPPLSVGSAAAAAEAAATQANAPQGGGNTAVPTGQNATGNNQGNARNNRASTTGRDLPTIKAQLAKNKEFLDAAFKVIDKSTGHYTISDYMKEQVKNLDQLLDAHQMGANATHEDMEYLENEQVNCLLTLCIRS